MEFSRVDNGIGKGWTSFVQFQNGRDLSEGGW